MKDILKTMIDNNEPHWSADTMSMVRAELEHVYAQAPKADEYEAKAKAFDEISKLRRKTIGRVRTVGLLAKFGVATWNVINKHERGESE